MVIQTPSPLPKPPVSLRRSLQLVHGRVEPAQGHRQHLTPGWRRNQEHTGLGLALASSPVGPWKTGRQTGEVTRWSIVIGPDLMTLIFQSPTHQLTSYGGAWEVPTHPFLGGRWPRCSDIYLRLWRVVMPASFPGSPSGPPGEAPRSTGLSPPQTQASAGGERIRRSTQIHVLAHLRNFLKEVAASYFS